MKTVNKKSDLRVLINAEPFGFGPSAAIADLYPHLREQFNQISYVGRGHTLDLQRPLDYDQIYELKQNDPKEFTEIVKNYDLFITALHFEKAQWASELNIPTVIFDPLTWFWREMPSVIKNSNVLYLAQDFHGVKERLKKIEGTLGQHTTVPPLIKSYQGKMEEKNIILVNLGGLQNPFWELKTCCDYASLMLKSIRRFFSSKDKNIIVMSGKSIALQLDDEQMINLERQEVLNILPKVKLAIATSGLGNIYDGSAYNIPTLFLPPPGDSHGQQLEFIRENDQIDYAIDWGDIHPSLKVNYRLDQVSVLKRIALNIDLLEEPFYFNLFLKQMDTALNELADKSKSKLTSLLNQFGQDGTSDVINQICQFANSINQKEVYHD